MSSAPVCAISWPETSCLEATQGTSRGLSLGREAGLCQGGRQTNGEPWGWGTYECRGGDLAHSCGVSSGDSSLPGMAVADMCHFPGCESACLLRAHPCRGNCEDLEARGELPFASGEKLGPLSYTGELDGSLFTDV